MFQITCSLFIHFVFVGTIVVFGGWDDNLQPRNDVFVFDIRGGVWTRPEVKGLCPCFLPHFFFI